jgi:hypothetical protein
MSRMRTRRSPGLAARAVLALAALVTSLRAAAPAIALDDRPLGAAPETIDGAARLAMTEAARTTALGLDEGPAEAVGEGEAGEGGEGDGELRSPTKAFFLSMILPGLGQRYYGANGKALACFIAEGALWTTFAVFKVQGNMREEDFEEWAQMFASAKVDGYDRDEEYFQRVSRYLSSDDYNLEVKYIARLIYPNDREAQFAYIDQNSVTGDDTWEWTSGDTRDQFRVIRSRALDSDTHANWTLGGLVLLRIVSAIDAALGTSAANRHVAGGDLGLRPAFPSGEPGFALGYTRGF